MFQKFYFIVQGSCFFSVDIADLLFIYGCFIFKDRSSSVKYDFIAIISPYSFDSRDSNLAFREDFPVVRTRGGVFIPAIGVAGNDLFIDGIGLLIISLILVTISLSLVS